MKAQDRDAARAYLNAALHPFGCKANRMVLTGGVTDPLFCDCGLEALRRINAAYHGDTVAGDPRPLAMQHRLAAEHAGEPQDVTDEDVRWALADYHGLLPGQTIPLSDFAKAAMRAALTRFITTRSGRADGSE